MVACSTPAILAVIAGAEILLVVLDDLSPTIATTRAPTDIRPRPILPVADAAAPTTTLPGSRRGNQCLERRQGAANHQPDADIKLQDGPRAELAKKLSHFSEAPPRGLLPLI
jgi:hypothetical protein